MNALRHIELVAGLAAALAGSAGAGFAMFAVDWEPVSRRSEATIEAYFIVCWTLSLLVGVGAYRHTRRRDDSGILLIAFPTILLAPAAIVAFFSVGLFVAPAALCAVLALVVAAGYTMADRASEARG